MPVIHRTLDQFVEGDRHARVQAIATLGMWFAAGAFVCSTAATYAEELLKVDIAENWIAFGGGLALAGVAAFFKAA